LWAVLAWNSVAGCAATGGGDYASGRRLPLSVGVYFDAAGSRFPTGGPPAREDGSVADIGVSQPLAFAGDPQQIVDTLADVLAVEEAVVERAVPLVSRDRAGALREGKSHDFVLGVRLQTPPEYGDEISAANALVEAITWLFGIGFFPSWFIPTHEYAVETELALDAVDLNHPEVQRWLEAGSGTSAPPEPAFDLVERVETKGLSLFDRARLVDDADDYLLTVLIPPMFVVPGDTATASESLTAAVISELCASLVESLRDRLTELELSSPLRVVFADPAVDARGILRFDILSTGAARLNALDVYRLASRESGLAPYGWGPSAAQLRGLDQALAQSRDGRVPVELAEPMPLAAGINVIKVRILRDDGVRASRTVVVFHREGNE
jgi:hypothetical protein